MVACVVASVTARELIGPALIYNPPLRLAMGGLAVGLIADMLRGGDGGGGVGSVGSVGSADSPWVIAALMLGLVVAKLAATTFTLGTGNSAGSFSPAVFMGAALAGAFGHAALALMPGTTVEPRHAAQ